MFSSTINPDANVNNCKTTGNSWRNIIIRLYNIQEIRLENGGLCRIRYKSTTSTTFTTWEWTTSRLPTRWEVNKDSLKIND